MDSNICASLLYFNGYVIYLHICTLLHYHIHRIHALTKVTCLSNLVYDHSSILYNKTANIQMLDYCFYIGLTKPIGELMTDLHVL